MTEHDAGEESIRALLAVEPLDEVARRRLVTTAVRTTRPSRPGRWIAIAAAVVVVLVVLGAVVLASPGDDRRQAATPARTPAAEQQSGIAPVSPSGSLAAPAAGNSSPRASAAPGSVPDAGEFGDLSDPANLAQLRAALTAVAGPDTTAPFGTTLRDGHTLMTALATRPCRGSLPAGTIAAVASGTIDGRRVIVVLTTTSDGDRSIDAVFSDPCTVRPLP
ncbi:MAG TPA: hypothetical protein VGA62_00275 [Acidimicrobiia bacterium]